MKIFICDDDKATADMLCSYVEEFFSSKNLSVPRISVFYSGEDMLECGEIPDFAFLDVEMSGISGIFAGAKMIKANPLLKIFIVTSFPDYLDEAMKYHAYRYLSKPIDKNRLFRNLSDAVNLYFSEIREISVETKNGFYLLKSIDIIYIETSGRKTLLHTAEKDFVCLENIDSWEEKLKNSSFYRSYRSYIVNMKYITGFTHDMITLKIGDREGKAYLSKRKYQEFRNAFLLYKEKVR